MKLSQIQEAKHHAHHPILSWLQQAFARENVSHGIFKHLTKEEFDELHDVLPNHLGDPDIDGDNMSWRHDNDYGRFYVDLQNQGGGAPEYSRFRLTVARIDQPAAAFNTL